MNYTYYIEKINGKYQLCHANETVGRFENLIAALNYFRDYIKPNFPKETLDPIWRGL